MSGPKRILVTGATGKQGGALIAALLKHPPTPFEIIALTRDATSARARALASKPHVSVIEGNLDDTAAIFKKAKDLHGVFSVQSPLNPATEEAQGKSLVDTAATNGVRHFIYTSADRGGPERSDTDSTNIKHFISKFRIENYLKAVAEKTPGMQWTIIRPVAFMDNISPGFFGKGFMAMWKLNGADRRLQLVSSQDIGVLAADAFNRPDRYYGKSLSLATDEISPSQASAIFARVVGSELPSSYSITGRLLKLMLHEQLGVMFDWFKSSGFGADANKYQKEFPEMQDFEQWLRHSSAWSSQIQSS